MLGASNILASRGATDDDARAFFHATGITDNTIRNAVNNLVIQAKVHGWWSLCSAIYPFVGGTSTTCAFNLKDPRDLDAAFRLTFTSGWSFASTGATSDGAATTVARTHLIPSSTLALNDAHLSIYSRTSAAGSATSSDIGATNSGTQDFRIIIRRSNNSQFSIIYGTSSTATDTLSTDGAGMWLGSRTASNVHRLYRNSSLLLTAANNNTDTRPSVEMYIGATNVSPGTISGPTAREYAFATIGLGISDTLQPIMYADIQAFNTILARQV